MKLYYSPGSCSLAAHITVLEAGLPAEAIAVNLRTHQLPDGSDYYAINPLGYVPLLALDDGATLLEIPAIVQYLADQAPARQLAPANGTLPRYQLQQWLNFVATELHKSYSPLFNPQLAEEAKTKDVYRSRLRQRYEWLDAQLKDRNYLVGNAFTVADAYLFVVTRWAAAVKLDLQGLPHLQAFQDRIAARPAVQDAMRAQGLIK